MMEAVRRGWLASPGPATPSTISTLDGTGVDLHDTAALRPQHAHWGVHDGMLHNVQSSMSVSGTFARLLLRPH